MLNHCNQYNNASGLLLNKAKLSENITSNLVLSGIHTVFVQASLESQSYPPPPLLSLCYLASNFISLILRVFN